MTITLNTIKRMRAGHCLSLLQVWTNAPSSTRMTSSVVADLSFLVLFFLAGATSTSPLGLIFILSPGGTSKLTVSVVEERPLLTAEGETSVDELFPDILSKYSLRDSKSEERLLIDRFFSNVVEGHLQYLASQ